MSIDEKKLNSFSSKGETEKYITIIDLGADELSESEFPFSESLRDDIVKAFAEDVYSQISGGKVKGKNGEDEEDEDYLITHALMIAELSSLLIGISRQSQINDCQYEIVFNRIPAVKNPNFKEPEYILKYTYFKDNNDQIIGYAYEFSRITALSKGEIPIS